MFNRVRSPRFTQLINFFEVPTLDIAYDMVKRGNVDCSLFELALYKVRIQKETGDAPLPAVVASVNHHSVHVGFSKIHLNNNPEFIDVIQLFDEALLKIKLNGELGKVLDAYKSNLN